MKVRMLKDVMSELPLCVEAPVIAERGVVYPAVGNRRGAISVILTDGERLGVKPGEFEIVEEKP